jgi:exonuclease III
MIRVMFWNINKLGDYFCNQLQGLTHERKIDILLLAESTIADDVILDQTGLTRVPLKSNTDEGLFTPKMYSRLKSKQIEHRETAVSKRMIFYSLNTKEYGEILLTGLHFPSKVYYDSQTQDTIAAIYSNWIKNTEDSVMHKRTILFGDFNMNPFESGMIKPDSFNATLSYDIARSERTRNFHYKEYDYFYNPMWSYLGDRSLLTGNLKLPGSYYYKSTTDVTQTYWNIFDKVIIRPDIIDCIDYSSIEIHEFIPQDKFIKVQTRPDHHPLFFNLNIEKI